MYVCIKLSMYLVEISISSLNQNNEQSPWTSQNLYFQSNFSVLKISGIFPEKKKSMKNIWIGAQLLLINVFEKFDF